jgi:hypothetical protein
MCDHQPECPSATAPDHTAARIVSFHPEQGWYLLCNGVIAFDDTGELLPSGLPVPPHRPRPMAAGRTPRGRPAALAQSMVPTASVTRPERWAA